MWISEDHDQQSSDYCLQQLVAILQLLIIIIELHNVLYRIIGILATS